MDNGETTNRQNICGQRTDSLRQVTNKLSVGNVQTSKTSVGNVHSSNKQLSVDNVQQVYYSINSISETLESL